MIDWSRATDEELGELYDALYERNDRLEKAIDGVHIRINGDRMRELYQFKTNLLHLSCVLSQEIFEEIQKRGDLENRK